MDGDLLVELSKISLKEENVCEEKSTVDQSDFFYEFSKLTFTKGKSPTVVCSLCKREGHLKKDCPEDFKRIQLEPLPPLTPKFSNILDQVCIQCYKDFSPTILEDQAREHIRQNLENFIRQEFPGTKLSLFGSSKNGFGFKQSDLDVCMTINGLETAEGLDCVRTIEELARVLKKHSGLRNILPITTAKVPIVKFFHLRSGLEVDISLYNTLSPTVVCSLCKREGHLKKDCPEDFKRIQLEPLPPLTPKFSNILDQVCIQCYKDFSPTILEDQAREHIRQNLENFIRQEFPGTKLSLFGSSKNGFGFKQSDLDVCMTINGLETAEGLDCVRTIEELARVLKKHSGLRNILPITTAKVPIVKFFHLRSGLEVDISLYNTLALHNTRLLSAYSAIDPRVKYLCYTMKVFTKMCDIGDASRGSLSSYAYTLMVLYFLQQRNPPVIPVLQEIYKGEKKPEIFVDGWNIYFFDQIDELPTYWPEYGKNTESVGQLWLGLLRFYTEEFDFKEHVISIRRKSLLTTFKKQWTSKYIVIEDVRYR